MTIFEIYQAVNFRLAKDKQGNAFTPNDFNVALKAVNETIYSQQLNLLLRVGQDGRVVVLNDEFAEINWFRSRQTLKGNQLPLNYRQYISILKDGKLADIVTPLIYDSYTINALCPIITERPPVIFFASYVMPYDGDYELTYFRKADEPYMDYCIDANGQTVFMPVGSRINSLGGNLLDVQGNVLKTAVTHLYAQYFPYLSTTRELDWRATFHSEFIKPLCEWGSANLRDQLSTVINK